MKIALHLWSSSVLPGYPGVAVTLGTLAVPSVVAGTVFVERAISDGGRAESRALRSWGTRAFHRPYPGMTPAGGEAAAWEIYYQAVTCLQGHEADLCSVGFDAENSIWGIALFLEVCAIGALSAAGAIGQVREMQGGRERYWPVARSRY